MPSNVFVLDDLSASYPREQFVAVARAGHAAHGRGLVLVAPELPAIFVPDAVWRHTIAEFPAELRDHPVVQNASEMLRTYRLAQQFLVTSIEIRPGAKMATITLFVVPWLTTASQN